MIKSIVDKIKKGYKINFDEAEKLMLLEDKSLLYNAANQIREYFNGNKFDLCSILNAKSGRCTENCHWCSQSRFHKTGIAEYEIISEETAIEAAKYNESKSVNRFSLVTSGKTLSNKELDKCISIYNKIKKQTSIHLCASMGLLKEEQLVKLKASGVTHYHCNIETSASFFPNVCTTHTYEDKLKTIENAKKAGLNICSGVIIGMGETAYQRLEMAFELRNINAKSIPVNVLFPVDGTALQDMKPLSEEEILTCIAMFRLINPDAMIRFAGGRALIKHFQPKALRAGINASIVGDMLTTAGTTSIQQDIVDFKNEGFLINDTNVDAENIWHPYSSAFNNNCLKVKSGRGVYLELDNGNKLIDGMSSWWCVINGYNNPVLNNALKNQADKISHVMFGGLTHEPAIKLSEKLLEILPSGLNHIFYSDSGSVAVEVAMKMALQYQQALGKTNKNKFLTFLKAYHGDTWNAMSVCDPHTGMHNLFSAMLPQQIFVNQPSIGFYDDWKDDVIIEIQNKIVENHHSIAAFILEPIVQGAGAMFFYHPDYLKKIRALCDKYDILLIADEIATGFGRTGKMFACNHAAIVPDIMCLGKAITGGYLSFAATVCARQIAKTISENEPKVFMHGPTFMANPLACAVAEANISFLLSYDWSAKINLISDFFNQHFKELKSLKNVKEIRILGAIAVVEMNENVNIQLVTDTAVKNGIWLRPFKNLVYLMPPFVINEKELIDLCNGFKNVINTINEL